MKGFFRQAIRKVNKLTDEQLRELLKAASYEISMLQIVLDSLPSGIIICNEKHSLVLANKSAYRLLPLSQIEGGPLWEQISDKAVSAFFKQALCCSEKTIETEIDAELFNNKKNLLSVSIHPLVEKKRITGSLIYIDDISEKRAREISLRRAENLASLTTVAAGIAHEIKNPLGSISIHLQLIQKKLGSRDESIKKYFKVLNEEVDRLNQIVVDFLFAVRPMTLDLRRKNINSIISEIAEFINKELDRAKIRLLLELDEKLHPALVDERYMKQVLLNLIKNAKAAMPDGGLLTIATTGSETEIKIIICDTGEGINPENLKKIFEPYFTTRNYGTGLGLTLAYKIIKEHRGEITVESKEREGTRFEIILPAYLANKPLLSFLGEKDEK